MEILFSMLLGIGLSAAVGFRIFAPFFLLSLASYFNMWDMSAGFEWMNSLPAVVALGTATAVEIGAYFIPWVDNLLDTIAIPLATLGGSALMFTTLGEVDPMFQWIISIIAGGGTAGIIKGATSGTRVVSTATTGGLANPLIAGAETSLSFIMTILAMVVAPIAGAISFGLLIYMSIRLYRWMSRKTTESAA